MDEIIKNAISDLQPTPPIPKGLKEPSEEPRKSWWFIIAKGCVVFVGIGLLIYMIMKGLGWI